MGKKKFDKNKSVTFKLVHRSLRDPLSADERAPQHVLLPLSDDNAGHSNRQTNRQTNHNHNNDTQKRKDLQQKYGIYFDDDYNYLQHLRDVKSVNDWQPIESNERQKTENTLLLPSSLFASNIEEHEGLLNKAVLPVGPQPDWDPDIVAAMDEDFDYEDPNNQILDDFVLQAEVIDGNHDNSNNNDDNDDEWEDCSEDDDELNDESDDESTVCDQSSHFNDDNNFADEETKSHFTNYSMTSSVMRRNEGLTTLDQRFETLFEKEYSNECDIGSLDLDDTDGYVDPNNSELMRQLIEQFKHEKNNKIIYENDCSDHQFVFDENRYNSEKLIEIELNENCKNVDKDRFDCESILSTYSNLYNHPKIIRDESIKSRVKINPKTGIPFGVIDRKGLTARNLAKLDELNNDMNGDAYTKSIRSSMSRLSELSMRSNNETPDERRLRKLALREYRRERRLEKKSNKLAFKSEQLKQNNDIINLQKNLKTVKLI